MESRRHCRQITPYLNPAGVALLHLMYICALLIAAVLGSGRGQSEPPSMQVIFERSGGFAGLRLLTTVDTATLSAEEAALLPRLIESAAFFKLPQRIGTAQPGADRFRYMVQVETQEQRHTVEIEEGAAPASLRPLLEWLTAKAKGGTGGVSN